MNAKLKLAGCATLAAILRVSMLVVTAQETTSPTTAQLSPTATAAFRQAASTGSSAPIKELLGSLHGTERGSVLVNMFLATEPDTKIRSDVLDILFAQSLGSEGLETAHLQLLTQAYLKTLQSPAPLHRGRSSNYSDGLIQSNILICVTNILNLSSGDMMSLNYIGHSPQDWLNELFDKASHKPGIDAETVATIHACQDALRQRTVVDSNH